MLIDIHKATEAGDVLTLRENLIVLWNGKSVKVPAGFESDGASVPRFLWRLVSPCVHQSTIRAAFVHDCIYRTKPEGWSRAEADELFRTLCKEDGLEAFRAELAYWGLRCFGWAAWKQV